jgi:hypothetical protein
MRAARVGWEGEPVSGAKARAARIILYCQTERRLIRGRIRDIRMSIESIFCTVSL